MAMHFRFALIGAFAAAALCAIPAAAVPDELIAAYEQARKDYDLAAAENLVPQFQEAAAAEGTEEARLDLARAALLVAELRRLDYENAPMRGRDRRILGRAIDDVANIGLDTLDGLPDSSEKYRIEADLLGTIIRSKFRGSRYSDRMTASMAKAIELNPENPEAWVTGSKRMLFASERYGGDVPKALEYLNKALELDPDHERAIVFRGIAYEKLGETEKSKEDVDRALEINPKSRIAELRRLKFEETEDAEEETP
jgi:tetratricopeptide (TPR) repeat protein